MAPKKNASVVQFHPFQCLLIYLIKLLPEIFLNFIKQNKGDVIGDKDKSRHTLKMGNDFEGKRN